MKSSSKKKDEVNLAKGGVEQPALSKVFKTDGEEMRRAWVLDEGFFIEEERGVWVRVSLLRRSVGSGGLQWVDEEEYGGVWELTKEGFMTSFALFLVGGPHKLR
ncbi:hypothetical protein JZ751_011404 [Albula glossodonta]|uniref:Uncharacterized protein n=1 Tax=Albula glossodonta TaxID=121402 RepID=A0A8T2MME1_9TELE|nr:hypothetical protein JZ751_011404 [Albula glossodonta]